MSFEQSYQHWVKSINLKSQLLVILGIGDAEHLFFLRSEFKGKIIAIDFKSCSVLFSPNRLQSTLGFSPSVGELDITELQPSIQTNPSSHPASLHLAQTNIDLIYINDTEEIYSLDVFKQVALHFSSVYQFRPACLGQEEKMIRLKQILTGKDFYAFLNQSENLQLNNSQIDIKEKVKGQNISTPVKELAKWPIFSSTETALIWSAIKEVIK